MRDQTPTISGIAPAWPPSTGAANCVQCPVIFGRVFPRELCIELGRERVWCGCADCCFVGELCVLRLRHPVHWRNHNKNRQTTTNCARKVSTPTVTNITMDYSYLNQAAAASFDTSCLQSSAVAAGMDPGSVGLGQMPCSYGDLTSCSQMSQAAYRYTAAAASMARSYNPVAASAGGAVGGVGGAGAVMMGGLHHGGSPVGGQCAVMGPRGHHHQDMHHRTTASMFSSSMSMQRMFLYC